MTQDTPTGAPESPLDQDSLAAALIRSALDSIIIADDKGRVLEFNPAAEKTFGYTRAEVLGAPVPTSLGWTLPKEAVDAWWALIRDGDTRYLNKRLETVGRRKDGSVFPVELTVCETRQDERRLWAAYVRDLSERRKAEAAARESELRLQAFLENAPVGMYLKDAEGRYLLCNREMERVFQRPLSEVVGRSAADVFGEDEAAMIAAFDRQVLDSGKPLTVEEQLPDQDAYEWTMVVRFPIFLDGKPAQIGGFDIDITEQKRADAELRRSREALYQSEKLSALGTLLAGVAHELNNPLSVVVGQSLILQDETSRLPELSDRATKIRKAAERCARIVRTFLAMARRRPPLKTRVDLKEVIRAALEISEYGLRTSGVSVRLQMPDDLPPIWADGDQIHQVLVNLIVNARQAMERVDGPRELTLTAVERSMSEARRVEITVSDTGPGVPIDLRTRIFEPFFSTKTQGEGTGVGLSLSLGIAQEHGGYLVLDETESGASFTIVLPVDEQTRPAAANDPVDPGLEFTPEARPVAPVDDAAPLRRVLLVDDEADVADTLAEIIVREGYEVVVAVGGAEAVRRLQQPGRWSAVVTDLRMPDVDGEALYAWIESNRPELLPRVGFTTGDALGKPAGRFLARTGRPVLAKPFTPAAVRRLLADVAAPHSETAK